MHKIVEYGKQYPYAFPLRFGPFACFLTIHHPDYVKTILGSTGERAVILHCLSVRPSKDAKTIFRFPTEPKDDLTVSFIEPWIGKIYFPVTSRQKCLLSTLHTLYYSYILLSCL